MVPTLGQLLVLVWTARLYQADMRHWSNVVYCWSSVVDVGPALKQHWTNVSCLLGYSSRACRCRHSVTSRVYCSSGNFHVFKFSRISDFETLNKVYNSRIFIFLQQRYFTNNFREILKFAKVSSSRNSRNLKSCEYY